MSAFAILSGTALLGVAPPAAAADFTLAEQILGTWGMRDKNGNLSCVTMQIIKGGTARVVQTKCRGEADETRTEKWSVNEACHLIWVTGTGKTVDLAVTFNGRNQFTTEPPSGTHFRK